MQLIQRERLYILKKALFVLITLIRIFVFRDRRFLVGVYHAVSQDRKSRD